MVLSSVDSNASAIPGVTAVIRLIHRIWSGVMSTIHLATRNPRLLDALVGVFELRAANR